MNNKKTLFFSIVTVLLMGLMISGGTFAFFQWSTNESQRTNINVIIPGGGGMKMVITPYGGQLEASGLKPVSDCMESYAYFDTRIDIINASGSLAVPSLKLKARIKPNPVNQSHLSPQEQPNLKFKVSDLSHIHYTVVEISNIGQTIKTDKADNSGARRCYEPSHIQKDGAGRNGWFESSTNFSTIATGTFADMSNLKGTGNKSIIDTDDNGFVDIDAGNKTEGQQSVVGNRFTDNDAGWSPYINLPTTKGVYLARQYNNDSVKGDLGSFGITFVGATASAGRAVTTTKYFRVYIWVDGGYTYTNIGSEVEQGDGVPIQDPLQNAVIEVNWSEDSMIQQVTG